MTLLSPALCRNAAGECDPHLAGHALVKAFGNRVEVLSQALVGEIVEGYNAYWRQALPGQRAAGAGSCSSSEPPQPCRPTAWPRRSTPGSRASRGRPRSVPGGAPRTGELPPPVPWGRPRLARADRCRAPLVEVVQAAVLARALRSHLEVVADEVAASFVAPLPPPSVLSRLARRVAQGDTGFLAPGGMPKKANDYLDGCRRQGGPTLLEWLRTTVHDPQHEGLGLGEVARRHRLTGRDGAEAQLAADGAGHARLLAQLTLRRLAKLSQREER